MQAYTYSIRQISTGLWYYGCRKSTTMDIGVGYFSSSNLVKRLISENGVCDFEFKCRRQFNSYAEARLHETKFLKRVHAVSNKTFLNQAISAPRIPSKDPKVEAQRKNSISNTMTKLWSTSEYRDNHPFINLSIEESKRRGLNGARARAAKYADGTIPKKHRIINYKMVEIIRNGVKKEVKSNQVPAYRKYGWKRMPP